MDDAERLAGWIGAVVGVGQRFQHLVQHEEHQRHGQAALADLQVLLAQLLKIAPVDVFERQEKFLARPAEVEHRHDVRVREARLQPGLVDELGHRLLAAGQVRVQTLDHEVALEAFGSVRLGEVHLGHAPFAESAAAGGTAPSGRGGSAGAERRPRRPASGAWTPGAAAGRPGWPAGASPGCRAPARAGPHFARRAGQAVPEPQAPPGRPGPSRRPAPTGRTDPRACRPGRPPGRPPRATDQLPAAAAWRRRRRPGRGGSRPPPARRDRPAGGEGRRDRPIPATAAHPTGPGRRRSCRRRGPGPRHRPGYRAEQQDRLVGGHLPGVPDQGAHREVHPVPVPHQTRSQSVAAGVFDQGVLRQLASAWARPGQRLSARDHRHQREGPAHAGPGFFGVDQILQRLLVDLGVQGGHQLGHPARLQHLRLEPGGQRCERLAVARGGPFGGARHLGGAEPGGPLPAQARGGHDQTGAQQRQRGPASGAVIHRRYRPDRACSDGRRWGRSRR